MTTHSSMMAPPISRLRPPISMAPHTLARMHAQLDHPLCVLKGPARATAATALQTALRGELHPLAAVGATMDLARDQWISKACLNSVLKPHALRLAEGRPGSHSSAIFGQANAAHILMEEDDNEETNFLLGSGIFGNVNRTMGLGRALAGSGLFWGLFESLHERTGWSVELDADLPEVPRYAGLFFEKARVVYVGLVPVQAHGNQLEPTEALYHDVNHLLEIIQTQIMLSRQGEVDPHRTQCDLYELVDRALAEAGLENLVSRTNPPFDLRSLILEMDRFRSSRMPWPTLPTPREHYFMVRFVQQVRERFGNAIELPSRLLKYESMPLPSLDATP